MIYGIIAGVGLGAGMFALSGDVLWLVLGAVGVALGLGIGATVGRNRPSPDRDGMIVDDGQPDDAGAGDGRNDPSGGAGAAR